MPPIKKDDFILGQSDPVSVLKEKQEARIDLMLQKNEGARKGMVFGAVCDPLGNAIPNTFVVLLDSEHNPIDHALTGQDGTYFLLNLEPNCSYSIYASAPGFNVASHEPISLQPRQEIEINLTMTYNTNSFLSCITGKVFSEQGLPIAHAILRLIQQGNQADSLTLQATTNGMGQFLFSEVPMGSYLMKVSAHGYQPYYEHINIPKQSQILNPTFTLHSGMVKDTGIISGVITDDQLEPVGNADVLIYRVEKDGREIPVATGKTLPNGVFLFVNLPAGNYVVKSSKTFRLNE